jgi:hypothetical protein
MLVLGNNQGRVTANVILMYGVGCFTDIALNSLAEDKGFNSLQFLKF